MVRSNTLDIIHSSAKLPTLAINSRPIWRNMRFTEERETTISVEVSFPLLGIVKKKFCVFAIVGVLCLS